ncbi:MAG: hypothetical protein HQL80_03945 [Magnetococcales bacterium]|nr:hypothetical protein [Magnetococcales bacterium]
MAVESASLPWLGEIDLERIKVTILVALVSVGCVWVGLQALLDSWQRYSGRALRIPFRIILPVVGIAAAVPAWLGWRAVEENAWHPSVLVLLFGVVVWGVTGIHSFVRQLLASFTQKQPEATGEEEQASAEQTDPPEEVKGVPLWVKGMVAVGVVLFAIRLPDFKASLMDATIKNRAAMADEAGRYTDAVHLYVELRTRHPSDNGLKKDLAFAQYQAAQYYSAMETFQLLSGVEMASTDVRKINAAIQDIESKLKQRKNLSE